jgi:hypothetical protein
MGTKIELEKELLDRVERAAAMVGVSLEEFVIDALEVRLRAFASEVARREESEDEMFG